MTYFYTFLNKKTKKQNTIANTEAELILRIFLIFVQSEPEYCCKLYSYVKKVCMVIDPFQVNELFHTL